MARRSDVIDWLKTSPEVSVLIIGAGINGIGTFRDLAHQDVDVLLVDKGDYGSGASAASSHMLHGGIRYLENGEFRLVREALTERNLMLRNAPHYAKPLPTTIPIFSWFSGFFNAPLKFMGWRNKPSERGALVIKIGLIFYDIFARNFRVMPTHDFMFKKRALENYPKMNKDIVCVAEYYDSFMPYPERICLELMMDGEEASEKARAINYMSAIDSDGETVTLKDTVTGKTYTVKPKLVVNAAGPWIDFANRNLGKTTQFIGGTKGSHLILDHPELYEAIGKGEVFFENDDGRIVLLLRYVDGKVMIGTTDIRIDDPELAVCTEDEIDYMLDMVDKVFPEIKIERSQIIFSFSGVRPLPYSDASYAGNISRDHSINVVPADRQFKFPVYSLVGGKWTTFRAFAEQTSNKALEFLGQQRKKSTQNMVIGGGKDYPQTDDARTKWINDEAQRTGLSVERISRLFERYGTYATKVANFMTQGEDAPLQGNGDFTRREIAFLTRESTQHVDDIVLRRSLMAWLGGIDSSVIDEIAGIMAEVLNWDEDRKQDEIGRVKSILAKQHHVEI